MAISHQPSAISHQDVGVNLRRINICGRLDSPGTDSVSMQLEDLVAEPKQGCGRRPACPAVSRLDRDRRTVRQRHGSTTAPQQTGAVVAEGSSVSMSNPRPTTGDVRPPRGQGNSGAALRSLLSLEVTGVDELIPVFTNSVDAEQAVIS